MHLREKCIQQKHTNTYHTQTRTHSHANSPSPLSLHTSVPLLLRKLKTTTINSVCFPDEGAAKRFGNQFKDAGFDIIICGKVFFIVYVRFHIFMYVAEDMSITIYIISLTCECIYTAYKYCRYYYKLYLYHIIRLVQVQSRG